MESDIESTFKSAALTVENVKKTQRIIQIK